MMTDTNNNSPTLTEEEIVSRWGQIRFYEIRISKRIPLQFSPYAAQCRRANVAEDWHYSRTIRCYSKTELEAKLAEVIAKVPSMTTKKLSKRTLPVDKVRISVWPVVRGYFNRRSRRTDIRDLKPIFRQTWDIG